MSKNKHKSVFENKDSVSESILSTLPDNGIILSETEIEFIEGESAFDVLYKALKEEKIFVRYFNKPRIDNYLRITIGTKEEMEILIDFLKKYLK